MRADNLDMDALGWEGLFTRGMKEFSLEQYSSAQQFFQMALERAASRGLDDIRVISTLQWLARCRNHIDGPEAAEEDCKKALKLAWLKLSDLLEDMGDYQALQDRDQSALAHLKQAVAIKEEHLAEEHPRLERGRELLRLVLDSLGKDEWESYLASRASDKEKIF